MSELAIDSPGVLTSLSRARRRGFAVLVGGVTLFVAFAVAAVIVADDSEELDRIASRVEGRVVRYSPGSRLRSESVEVEFEYAGEARRERIQLDDSSPAYEPGQAVEVLVDPADDRRFTIRGETNQSEWSVFAMIAALLAGAAGLVAGPWMMLRVRRQRRLLSAEPWRTVPVRYIEVPAGNSVRGLLLVNEDGADRIATLASVARWNLRRLGLRGTQEADIVGVLPGYVVLRAPGSNRLVSARSPYTSRARRRWERLFAEAA